MENNKTFKKIKIRFNKEVKIWNKRKKRTSKKEIVKEVIESKLIFTRTGISSITPRVSLPTVWVKHMGLSTDDKDLELTYSPRTKKITIRKKVLKNQRKRNKKKATTGIVTFWIDSITLWMYKSDKPQRDN